MRTVLPPETMQAYLVQRQDCSDQGLTPYAERSSTIEELRRDMPCIGPQLPLALEYSPESSDQSGGPAEGSSL